MFKPIKCDIYQVKIKNHNVNLCLKVWLPTKGCFVVSNIISLFVWDNLQEPKLLLMTGCNDDMYMCNTIFDYLKSALFETEFTSIASKSLPRDYTINSWEYIWNKR